MTTKRKFKSDAFEAIHASASALHRVGAIDKSTIGEFDELCLAEPSAIAHVEARGSSPSGNDQE